jgi:cystathionine beta-lyase
MKFGTKAIHAGIEPDPSTGAIMTPIFQTSTYVQTSPGKHKGYEYSRTQNPTRHALEKNLAALENAQHGFAFASGMAATDTVMKLLSPGDEVISSNDLYGGTFRIFTKVYENYGIKFHFVNMENEEEVTACLNKNTKMIWVETPTNPLLKVVDIEIFAVIAEENELLLVVDNTFATPYNQNPLDMGADIVLHSVTKYLGGHSDVVMGALLLNDEELAERVAFIQNSCGAVPGPQDAFLVLRGIKTLHLRMEAHANSAAEIAEYLESHPKVGKVFYPGLASHTSYEIAKRQMRTFGGMLSFELKGNDMNATIGLLENLKLFNLAESLGGVESLIGHPASMTHASIPKSEREKAGLNDSLIRLSVGIEDIDDLIDDLEQALAEVPELSEAN